MTASSARPPIIEPDVAIIGGGIAGLWLMNRLKNEGYDCVLLEKSRLGGDQSLASQGMIHGGIKYTLSGSLSRASESIADMPAYWSRCLKGEAEVDLREARILSDRFYFWTSEGLTSRMSTFFASKAVQGRMEKVSREEFPDLLKNPAFSGQVYRLQDIVVDTDSVLRSLLKQVEGRVYSLQDSHYRWQRQGRQAELLIDTAEGQRLQIRAKRFVFTAGRGNGEILAELGAEKPRMQLRPVHQVWVKHNLPYRFYGHCLGADTTPRISISTHSAADGGCVWSLGGSLAEAGVQQSEDEVIAAAKREMAELLPWVDMSGARWMAQRIDRAEARQRNFLRPDKAYAKAVDSLDNVIVGWPTKLTLAPNLANEVLQIVRDSGLQPNSAGKTELAPLPAASVSPPPWDRVFGVRS